MEDALYNELWYACAGPLVTVPRAGELVFYFPQGHIEQVASVLPYSKTSFYLFFLICTKLICGFADGGFYESYG